jgi:predicted amino acid-binding ACT domain protein
VLVCSYQAPAPGAGRGRTDKFVVTAFGQDKPGIIHRFSRYLAGQDINIVDWYWDCAGADFVLMAQVEIPEELDIGLLQADLDELGRDQGFNVRLQHENVFVATNRLRLAGAPFTHGL